MEKGFDWLIQSKYPFTPHYLKPDEDKVQYVNEGHEEVTAAIKTFMQNT